MKVFLYWISAILFLRPVFGQCVDSDSASIQVGTINANFRVLFSRNLRCYWEFLSKCASYFRFQFTKSSSYRK